MSRRLHRDDATVQSLFLFFARWKSPPDVASQGDLGRWVRGVAVGPDRARPSVKDNGVEGGRCGGAYLQDLLSSVQPFSHEVIELTSRM